jgi:methionyl aminopeptidase
VVHGIPNKTPLLEGDIVSVDCGVLLNGFFGDSAYTFEVGQVKPEIKALLESTKASLYKGIEAAVEGNRIGDIGYAVQNYCESRGYSVVREMVGHGVGRELHEAPEVPNYGRKGNGVKLRKGMVIAIEPMINLGKRQIVLEDDQWTIRTVDKSVSAHFEHTISVGKSKSDILSSFKFVEEVLTLQS